MDTNSRLAKIIRHMVSMSGQPLASQSLTAKILQGIDAKRAMIAGERRHTPVWAALQALIADYEDLQLDHTQVNVDIEDVCDQAHFLADMMLEYEWEDSKWTYQLEVAQQVDTLCQKLDSLLDWPKKRDYLVSLRSYPSQQKKKPTLNRAHAALPMG